MKVSVIIVNFNTRELTLQCLASIFKYSVQGTFEVILVDNASTDGSIDAIKKQFPKVIIIENEKNLGFGRANNVGALKATGEYLFLLNSDTYLMDDSIGRLTKYMDEHKEIGACGCGLLDVNLQPTTSHGKFPSILDDFSTLGFAKLYSRYYWQYISTHQTAMDGDINNVDYICGADIFIRRAIFDSLNGFDDDYFMYFEETDLFYRMKKMGYRSVIIPEINIVHLEGGSQKSRGFNLRKYEMFNNSRFLFYRKRGYNRFQIGLLKFFMRLFLVSRPMRFCNDWGNAYKMIKQF